MINVIFDNQDGLFFIDGKRIFETIVLSDGEYALLCIPYNKQINPFYELLSIKNSKISSLNYLNIANYSPSYVLLYLNNNLNSYNPQPQPYYQEEIKNKCTHYFTAYKASNLYYLTIETENEIYNVSTSNKLENIVIKSTILSDGELIVIKAKTNNKDYIHAILYLDDYYPILNCESDLIEITDEYIIIHDFLLDAYNREIIRKLSFIKNSYKEIDRQFIYHKNPVITDKIIPYLFIESIFCNDTTIYKSFLCVRLKDINIKSIFGDFFKIVNINSLYKEGRISLLYKNKKSQTIIRHFDFLIKDNLILDINEVKLEL